MKIRKGFVSNSSSSSFCILGTLLDEEEFPILRELEGVIDEDGDFDLREWIDCYLSGSENPLELDYSSGIAEYDRCSVILGKNVYKLDSSKTIDQQKTEIEKEIRRIFKIPANTEVPISFYVDGGYCG